MNATAVMESTTRDTTKLLSPQSVAVVGATPREGSVGYSVLYNLLFSGFQGVIYPINLKRTSVLGVPCTRSLLDLAEPPDLTVAIVPPQGVLDTMQQCAQIGCHNVLVISAGFKEIGEEGVALEQELKRIARENRINVVGPNCLGIINTDPKVRLNATFGRNMPGHGRIGFMSQSGALCTAILDYAESKRIEFSKFISFGNKADVNENDLLLALGNDPGTDVILMYIEDLTDGRRFIEIAREISGEAVQPKPILAIKSGRTAQGARAAASHTGSLAGTDAVYDAILTQAGVVRVDSVEELFDLAKTFISQPIPVGDRVGIVTNAGGPGIMATDACIRAGLQVPTLAEETRAALRGSLPPSAALGNPIDVIGDARSDRYEAAISAMLKSDQFDSLLVLLTPQQMTDIEKTAEVVVRLAKQSDKPVVPAFMGGRYVEDGSRVLRDGGLFNNLFPESAVRALAAMVRYRQWLKRPRAGTVQRDVDAERAREVIAAARAAGRTYLPEPDALQVLEAYGFPLLRSGVARSAAEAVTMAERIGFPVVMKIYSYDIVHKTDVGGVVVGLKDADAVRQEYASMMDRVKSRCPDADVIGVFIQQMAGKGRECILGANRDPQFGPLVMFGLGGVYVELMKDVTFRLAPIRPLGARRMVEAVKFYPILRGVRGEPPVDFGKLEECLERVSQLISEIDDIQELDINPLIVYPQGEGACVADVRIILRDCEP